MTAAATSDELAFVDRLLDSWAVWAQSEQQGRYSRPSLRYSSGRDALPAVLAMSDDQFGRVDRAVAQLQPIERDVIAVNYFQQYSYAPKRRKATMLGLSLRRYERILHQAQLGVMSRLAPDIYSWQSL